MKVKMVLCQLLMALVFLNFSSCSDDDDNGGSGSMPTAPGGVAACVNVAGSWNTTTTVDESQCGGGITSETAQVQVEQAEGSCSAILTEPDGAQIALSLDGNTITFSESSQEDGGTFSQNGTLTVSDDGSSLSGSSTWTFTEGGQSCSGTAQISGTKT